MKHIKLICLLASSMVVASCQKILEINPDEYIIRSETYYSTELQLETALLGVYAKLADDALYANNMLGRMGLEADEGFCSYSADKGSVAYYAASPADVKILGYWKSLYEGINNANAVLDNINRPVMDEVKRDRIKGQALFLRAYYYFMLVNKFGDVPLVLTQTISGDSDAVQIAKSPAKKIYDQIITDMTIAADLVADADAVKSAGQVSKSAVWGILARVCLYMAGNPINDESKYAEAAKWAGKVISSGKHELNANYSQIFINYAQDLYDMKESIWEVEFWGNGLGSYGATGGMVGRNNGISNTVDDNIGYSIGVIHPTAWLYNLYPANDLRRDWSIAPFAYSGNPATKVYWTTQTYYQRYAGKFRREYEILKPKSQSRTPQNFPLLRYSDVLLMYAEAVNEVSGPNDEIKDLVNSVRRRAFGKYQYGERVRTITVSNGGSNYTSAPLVSISGGGGTGATATAVISTTTGKVTSVTITDPGSFFSAAPVISFSGGGGSGAVAAATISTLTEGDFDPADLDGQPAFRLSVRDERARELSFEALRKNDLVRWGLLMANMKTILLEVPSGTTVFATSAQFIYSNVANRDILWPIPSYEIGVNRKLVQNEGW
ncbi:MAG: RagB/SusD family nutrient uptake outer membrane protein [Pedobacter sp.]|uniref:RagB/SusD family nutrient uptake outer membrane protein n=1 Tax=Pedobacter sp. TaxID=1411316 RepID=UPI00356567DA